jgi:hypothetical protein
MRSDFSDYSHTRIFYLFIFKFHFHLCRRYSVELEEFSPLRIGKKTICRYFKVLCPDGPRIIVKKFRLPDLWSPF